MANFDRATLRATIIAIGLALAGLLAGNGFESSRFFHAIRLQA